MSNIKVQLWGRTFDLLVEKARCKSAELVHTQEEAYQCILNRWDAVESSLDDLKRYCLKKNGEDIGASIDNIFKYVIPKALYIPRCKSGRTCAILCNYKFDPEHGLALVFKNEKLADIGPEDVIS